MAEKYSRLLNSHFLIHFELTDQLPRIQALCTDKPLLKGKFAERLLLYDDVVTPTVDFSIIPVLVSWMGEGPFRDALAQGGMSFLRFPGALGYAGGLGLSLFQMEPGKTVVRKNDERMTAFTKDVAMAIDVWLTRVLPDLSPRTRTKIARAVLKRTTLLDGLPNFDKNVEHETYMDALNSPELRSYFGIRSTDMRSLAPVGTNQIRVFSPNAWSSQPTFDEADILLGMAAINLELSLINAADATDAAFDPVLERFMASKAKRDLASPEVAAAFSRILQVNYLPDLAQVLANGDVSFNDLWKLRMGASAEIFRRWFNDHVADNPERAVNEYIASLSSVSWLNSAPLKAIRLLITSLTGGMASLVLGATDNALIGNSAHGRNPRYLIDDLKRKLPRLTGK